MHGLDLAAALDREPWMTIEAARVTEDLLLPCGAAGLRAETGWDRVGLIARLTGRHPVTPAETELIESTGIGRLALADPRDVRRMERAAAAHAGLHPARDLARAGQSSGAAGRHGEGWRWVRWPSWSRMHRTSAGPPRAPNACGIIVENSAA